MTRIEYVSGTITSVKLRNFHHKAHGLMSSEALAKPTITKNSSEFKQDAYASLSTGELVVFAVQVLQADAAPVAVEEVVSTCFRLFPHSFALKNYFYWPDSALVARRLHDAKEKGLLKGNPTDGYEAKGSGKQVAKQVAKVLGVSLPVPPKVEVVTAPVVETPKVVEVVAEKKEEEKKEAIPSAPIAKKVKKQEPKKKDVHKKVEKKASAKKPIAKATLKKDVASKKKVPPKAIAKKTVKPAPKPKATVVNKQVKAEKKDEKGKKKSQPSVKPKVAEKKQEISKKKVESAVKPEVKKVEPKVEKVAEKKVEKQKKEAKAQPKQLTMELAPAAAWKKAESPASKPKVKNEALPVKGEVLAPVAVSKEEKDKAAKVIKQIERSDAYQLYRRNGKRAQIGEFDFRNMLFATMESSPETLKRNLDLFKRYAGIHFRTDLIAFLEFCEESFAALMISKVKGKK